MAPKYNRNLQKSLKVNGVIVEALSVTGLARMVGKSRDTILRYEAQDTFPLAPIYKNGIRYYPVSLCKRLIPLVALIPGHKKPDAELVTAITRVFNEEKAKLYANNN